MLSPDTANPENSRNIALEEETSADKRKDMMRQMRNEPEVIVADMADPQALLAKILRVIAIGEKDWAGRYTNGMTYTMHEHQASMMRDIDRAIGEVFPLFLEY
jgi:hypothetical protein